MSEIVVEPYRGKWRVVMRDGNRVTVLGVFNARFKAEHEAEAHRKALEGGDE